MKAENQARRMKALGANLGGFDVVTLGRVIKAFLRSRLEYCLALVSWAPTGFKRLEVALNNIIRTITGMPKNGVSAEALRVVMQIESMTVRAASLRVRWLCDVESRTTGFMGYHARRLYLANCKARPSEVRGVDGWTLRRLMQTSCFYERPHITQLTAEIEADMGTIIEASGREWTARGRSELRKQLTKEWRQRERMEAAMPVIANYQGLSLEIGRMLTAYHVTCAHWHVGRILNYVLGRWPPLRVVCNSCGGTAEYRGAHFEEHVEETRRRPVVERALREAAALTVTPGRHEAEIARRCQLAIEATLDMEARFGAPWNRGRN
jgi:hypothetical protein